MLGLPSPYRREFNLGLDEDDSEGTGETSEEEDIFLYPKSLPSPVDVVLTFLHLLVLQVQHWILALGLLILLKHSLVTPTIGPLVINEENFVKLLRSLYLL